MWRNDKGRKMKRTNTSNKGNTLTLKKLGEFYNEVKGIPQPKYFLYENGVRLDFKCTFIHRVRRLYQK